MRNTKNQHSPRPVKVFYPGGSVGHCKSVKSAIICATRHLLTGGGMATATLTYEDVPVAELERTGNKIATNWKQHYFEVGAEA